MIAAPVTTVPCDGLIALLASPSLAVRVQAADALAALGIYADLLMVYGCDATRADIAADEQARLRGGVFVESDVLRQDTERQVKLEWEKYYGR